MLKLGFLYRTIAMSSKLGEQRLDELKKQVLQDSVHFLATNLGPPRRYFTELKAERILSKYDCEQILHEVTTKDQVEKFVDILSEGRRSKDGRSAFDVLVEALQGGGVHAAVAQELREALDKAVAEQINIEGM